MILIMGPAGAGKSVQGQKLVDTLGYTRLSTGAVLREAMQDPQIKERMEHGELLDDEIVEQIVAKALKQAEDPRKVILDGFPRDHHQARWLIGFCAGGDMSIEAVIHLNIDLEVARTRLLGRGRTDDHTEAIDKRFHEYQNTTLPILEYLDKQGVEILEIDGERTIDEVHEEIVEAIKSVHQG